MSTIISDRAFEWILADWAGFGDRPDELFPDLRGIDLKEIAGELDRAIGSENREMISRAGREKKIPLSSGRRFGVTLSSDVFCER